MPRGWVVVLGASSGFGAAIARAFAANGHPILGAHFDTRSTVHRAHEVQAQLEALGVPVVFHNANAADLHHRDAALDALRLADPDATVDVLVHSLAFGSLVPFVGETSVTPKQLDMTLSVMANSLVWWTQALVERGLMVSGGRIVAMTSVGGFVSMPSYGPVSAAKAALEAHVRQLAVELAPRQITVNAILAGLSDTPSLRQIPGWEALAETARSRNPHGRLTQPEDIADAVVALTGPGTGWMTGNTIRVDGGESFTA